VDISQINRIGTSAGHRANRASNLSGDKRFAAHWRFVIEQNAVRCVHSVGFTIIDGNPVGVELCHSIWATRVKWRGLGLRSLGYFAIQFRARGLVEADIVLHLQNPNSLEEA